MSNDRVLIIGGGMIGMATACLLARSGLKITVVESGPSRTWDPSQLPGRVSALNLASQKVLETAGVWQRICELRATPYRKMRVWDSHSSARIHFDAGNYAVPALGHIVENDLVVQAMRERLEQNYNVSLEYESALTNYQADSKAVSATIRTPRGNISIDTNLVIGADGARSSIRQLAQIPVVREDFDQRAIVATVTCERSHQDTAWQCFTPSGPVALLPLQGNQCSLVYSSDSAEAEQLLSKHPAALTTFLEEIFSDELGQLHIANTPRSFPLSNQHAETYIAKRVALVGDAAHTTHPLAGLGANIGLLDVAALSELVGQAHIAGRAIAGHSLLRRFERWRRGENAGVLMAMKTFKTVFGNTHPAMTQIRESGFRFADQLPPLKDQLAEYALGLAGDLPGICRQ